MNANTSWNRWKGIMKCVPFEEKRLLKWKPPFIVQPKYDGFRCRAVPIQTGPTGSEYILLSSEENIFYSVPHINEMFQSLRLTCELDGELYCHGRDFNWHSSVLSRTTSLHSDYLDIKFHCFDIVNDQIQMRRQLTIEALRGLHPGLVIAPFHLCESLDDVLRAYDSFITARYEGIIVRHVGANYEKKRSTYIMKFKPKQEDIYEIVGVVEEVDKNGNPKDSLGALVCKGSEGHLFNVGSGFTQDQRKTLWNRSALLPGSFARVQYQHTTSGKGVPRFPIFLEVIENA